MVVDTNGLDQKPSNRAGESKAPKGTKSGSQPTGLGETFGGMCAAGLKLQPGSS